MKIQHVSIQNYRSIESLELDFDDYGAFIGANGSGKSSVLYAVDWLVNGGNLEAGDVHGMTGKEIPEEGEAPKSVSVTVTFSDLNTSDRARLEKYGRGETLVVRRSWSIGDSKSKIVGRALQGPGFVDVRSAVGIANVRASYATLRATHTDLPEAPRLASAADIDRLLTAWEDEASHSEQLEAIDDDDASNFFGIDGQNRLKQCVRIILVPAASDIASEVAGTKRGSAVNELIGLLMTNAGAAAREAWIIKHDTAIKELTDSMLTSVETATGFQAERINERLDNLIAGAELAFAPSVPSWVPSPTPTVATDISIDGITNDVARQGHGIQRAVMIAMFQSLAPDEKFAERSHVAVEGETEAETASRLERVKEDLPSLVVCIEEPEIYQHPIRARSFARVLIELSTQPRAQVVVATHSPYFVKPENFESLRRFKLTAGKTEAKRATIDVISTKLGGGAAKRNQVERTINKQLPTTFSEGFFADAVVLVEGDTDKAVIEEVAEKLGKPLDAAGISVLDMGGKGNLRVPAMMLMELGIPTYVVADGDSLGAARDHVSNASARTTAHDSHRRDTENLITWLPSSITATHGTLPYAFEDRTVVCENFTIWEDDLEHELESWPSFVAAKSGNGHQSRSKDALAYRVDTSEASNDDVPESLKALVTAIHAFRATI